MKKFIALLCVVVLCAPALADWEPADGHKMHFPQLPDELGWDVNATNPVILADDWMCTRPGWIKDIHFWGSWRNGIEGVILSFNLSIHANIPDPDGEGPLFSMPGETLWEREITSFAAVPIDPPTMQGWYDPQTGEVFPNDHQAYFQYNIFLPEVDWFWQEVGTIYWLNITATVVDPVGTHWGWKSTQDHWEDDAVWGLWGVLIWDDIFEPPEFTQSLDLAFVVTGDGPIPTVSEWGLVVMTLLVLSAGTLVFRRFRAAAA